MQGAVNYLTGTVRVSIRARYEERVANICTQVGVKFWDMERRRDGTLTMMTTIGGYRKLREISKKSGLFTIKPERRKGVPFLLWRVRRRYALLVGMFLCFGAVFFSSFFVWQIEVTGNSTVSKGEIIGALKELGVDIGTCTLKINNRQIQNNILLMIPELSWITVNTEGSRAHVIVREKIEKPEIIDVTEPTSVYAEKSGIITKMTVLRGTPVVNVGDTVMGGELLVEGKMHILSGETDFVRADAEIIARTWYNMSEMMPLNMACKEYTGETAEKFLLRLGKKTVNLYFSGGNPYPSYDKITADNIVKTPDGSALPFGIIKETYAEYTVKSELMTANTAGKILEERLLKRLSQEIDDGEIVSADFEYSVENGVLTVSMSAECIENISVLKLMEPEELQAAPTQDTD